MDHTKRERIREVTVDGIVLEIDGYYDEDTPAGKYEWYDIFYRGECMNLGDPFYRLPSQAQLKHIAKNIRKEDAEERGKSLPKKRTTTIKKIVKRRR